MGKRLFAVDSGIIVHFVFLNRLTSSDGNEDAPSLYYSKIKDLNIENGDLNLQV
jgi:hypothetical protein